CHLREEKHRPEALLEWDRQKERAGDRALHGHNRQPPSPQGAVLMVFISVPGMCGWSNPYSQLPGVLGSSPCHGGDLRAPFLFVRFLLRPHLLTRGSSLPVQPCQNSSSPSLHWRSKPGVVGACLYRAGFALPLQWDIRPLLVLALFSALATLTRSSARAT